MKIGQSEDAELKASALEKLEIKDRGAGPESSEVDGKTAERWLMARQVPVQQQTYSSEFHGEVALCSILRVAFGSSDCASYG